jgi:hypothetical protein
MAGGQRDRHGRLPTFTNREMVKSMRRCDQRIATLLCLGAAACGGEASLPDEDPTLGQSEEALMCAPRAAPLDPRRSLFISDQAVLTGADFSLRRTLGQLARHGGNPRLDAVHLFRQLWDTQNPGPGVTRGPHCDDEVTNGQPSINGFPVRCGRAEGRQADVSLDPDGITPERYLDAYRPISLVNRFDLAPPTGEHCGEYRIVYGKDPTVGPGRSLVIFEAVLPNPNPGCGLAGCRPVQELWASMSDIASPERRAQRLAEFFYQGYRGFAPVIHPRHFAEPGSFGTTGTGQIRTNVFMSSPWTLREFKMRHRPATRRGAAELLFVPAAIKVNPQGFLFDGRVASSTTSPYAAVAAGFQQRFLGSIPSLAVGSLPSLSMLDDRASNAGESEALRDVNQNRYTFHFAQDGGASAFRTSIAQELSRIGSPLTPDQVVARAQTQSCAGCHDLSNNANLGGGLTWPASRRFVHTDERSTEAGPEGPRFPISVALTDALLPARLEIMSTFLANSDCRRCGRVRFRNTQSAAEEAAAQAGPRLGRGTAVH